MSSAAVVALLQTAMMLLSAVSSNPSLPQSFRDHATDVANQAITQAKVLMTASTTQAMAPQDATSTSSGDALTTDRTLRVGDSGSDVADLQKVLDALPEGGGRVPTSGYYGDVTKAAVRKFQSDNDLPSVGFVGPATRSLLNATYKLHLSQTMHSTNTSTNTNSASSQPNQFFAPTITCLLYTSPSPRD